MPSALDEERETFFVAWRERLHRDLAKGSSARAWVLARIQALSRLLIVATLIAVTTANVTNSFLLDSAFRDLPLNYQKWGLIAVMNGSAERPFAYRSLPAIGIAKLAQAIYAKWPGALHFFDSFELHYHYFSKVPTEKWTPVVSISYALMYFAVVLALAATNYLLYRMARLRGLTYAQSLGVVAAFGFILPFFFQRHGFYYDFFELCGAFAACYFFLRGKFVLSTVSILAASFVKESFFLVPFALYFFNEEGTPKAKRYTWLSVQLSLSIAGRLTIMHLFAQDRGVTVEHHFFENLAFWLCPNRWALMWQNAIAPAIYLPRIELYAIPAALIFWHGWKKSETRVRRYFLAAFLPLLLLYLPFGFLDEFRVFLPVFPAAALVMFGAVPTFGEIFGDSATWRKELERG